MGKAVQFDPTVIQTFASRLYRRANTIVVTSTVIGVILGVLAGIGLAIAVSSQMPGTRPDFVLSAGIAALIAGALGFIRGLERSFHLKLEAQLALCQLQIEANTRQPASGAP